MEHKKAAAILINMLERRSLDAEEKQAVLDAIGILGWASLAQSRKKSLKAKRNKSTEWGSRTVMRRIKKDSGYKSPIYRKVI